MTTTGKVIRTSFFVGVGVCAGLYGGYKAYFHPAFFFPSVQFYTDTPLNYSPNEGRDAKNRVQQYFKIDDQPTKADLTAVNYLQTTLETAQKKWFQCDKGSTPDNMGCRIKRDVEKNVRSIEFKTSDWFKHEVNNLGTIYPEYDSLNSVTIRLDYAPATHSFSVNLALVKVAGIDNAKLASQWFLAVADYFRVPKSQRLHNERKDIAKEARQARGIKWECSMGVDESNLDYRDVFSDGKREPIRKETTRCVGAGLLLKDYMP